MRYTDKWPVRFQLLPTSILTDNYTKTSPIYTCFLQDGRQQHRVYVGEKHQSKMSDLGSFLFEKPERGNIDRSSAICNLCKEVVKTSGGTTSLMTHIRRHHSVVNICFQWRISYPIRITIQNCHIAIYCNTVLADNTQPYWTWGWRTVSRKQKYWVHNVLKRYRLAQQVQTT